MAGCTFDNTNYVGLLGSGFVVVVNGAYVLPPSGLGTGNIWNTRCAAENKWNTLEGCSSPASCAGVAEGSGCTTSNGAQGCCTNGVCVAGGGGGGGGGGSGQVCVAGVCLPTIVAYGGAAIIALKVLGRR